MSRRVLPSNATGCLLGGAIGDAMGSAYEGQPPPVRIDEGRPWTLTDDTQLTLATCEALDESGSLQPARVAERFAVWHRHRRLTNVGGSTLKALNDLAAGGPWTVSGRTGEFAAGNGAAMRIAPAALLMDPEDDRWRRSIRDLTDITHKNDEAYAGALAIATAVSSACRGTWRIGDPLLSRLADRLFDCNVRDRIRTLASLDASTPIVDVAAQHGSSGYVVESVPLALFVAERVAAAGFESAVHAAITAGGDTDTVASMVGQIVGASVGVEGIPPRLRDRLQLPAELSGIVQAFAVHFENHQSDDHP